MQDTKRKNILLLGFMKKEKKSKLFEVAYKDGSLISKVPVSADRFVDMNGCLHFFIGKECTCVFKEFVYVIKCKHPEQNIIKIPTPDFIKEQLHLVPRRQLKVAL